MLGLHTLTATTPPLGACSHASCMSTGGLRHNRPVGSIVDLLGACRMNPQVGAVLAGLYRHSQLSLTSTRPVTNSDSQPLQQQQLTHRPVGAMSAALYPPRSRSQIGRRKGRLRRFRPGHLSLALCTWEGRRRCTPGMS